MLVAASKMGRQNYDSSRHQQHHQEQKQEQDDRAQKALCGLEKLRALLAREEQGMGSTGHRYDYGNEPINTHHYLYDNDAIRNPNVSLHSVPFSIISPANSMDCL